MPLSPKSPLPVASLMSANKKYRKDRFYIFLLHAFSHLPMLWLQRIGHAIGWLAFYMRRATPYRIVKRNLQIAYPNACPTWIERTIKANLINTAPVAFECAKSWGMPVDYTPGLIKSVVGEEIFLEALSAGRGTLVIAPHFGTFELMNAWINQHTPNTIMFKPGKDKGVNQFVRSARARYCTILPADESGVRGTFKTLKKGGVCAILPDQVPQDNNGIFAPFFGISTWSGTIVPRLVERTGCSVVMMSCSRRPDGDGFEIVIESPDSGIYSSDLLAATTALNRTVERLAQRAPEHYFWFYKRFKRNESLPDPYR